MTDAEINRAITKEVLGWRLVHYSPMDGKDYWSHPGGMAPTPDYLTWDGFGLLWEALVLAGRKPALTYNGVLVDGAPVVWIIGNRTPQRALMLAAASAYGMEGV